MVAVSLKKKKKKKDRKRANVEREQKITQNADTHRRAKAYAKMITPVYTRTV